MWNSQLRSLSLSGKTTPKTSQTQSFLLLLLSLSWPRVMEATQRRLRINFQDRLILSKTQKKNGLKHSWVLLKPQFQTISDVVSYLLHSFDLFDSCPNGIILSVYSLSPLACFNFLFFLSLFWCFVGLILFFMLIFSWVFDLMSQSSGLLLLFCIILSMWLEFSSVYLVADCLFLHILAQERIKPLFTILCTICPFN